MTPTLAILILLAAAIPVLIRTTAAPRPRKNAAPRPKSEIELYREAFVDDPDLVSIDDWFGIGSRDGRFTVRPRHIGDSRIWEVRGPTLKMKGRTTWRCAPEGILSSLFDVAGLGDVKTGDAAFDARVMITGSDRDVVRGLIGHPEVRQAVDLLMNGQLYVIGCEVDWKGGLMVRFHCDALDAASAREAFRSAKRLADALDGAAEVAPVPPPIEAEVGAVSASSGAPVGFGVR